MKPMRRPWVYNLLGILFLIGIAYAIALPNFVGGGPTTKNSCIANLKQIDGAIQQWALVNHRTETSTPNLSAAMKYLKNGELPKCPSGGSYAAGKTIADAPTCTMGKQLGHTLP